MKSYTHNIGTFIGKGGIEIFFQNWSTPNPKGILVLVHGVGEHSGRYGNLINKLEGKNISIYGLDHRGHGKSGGKKGHVDSFMDYVYDVKVFIDHIKEEIPNKPIIILGHSMGGLIANKYALEYPDDLSALILSSSLLMLAKKPPQWQTGLSNILSKSMPTITIPNGLCTKDLSHDYDVIDAYENDPLVHNKVSVSWVTDMIKTSNECINRIPELKMPLLIIHGKEDKIVDYKGSELLYKNASSKKKEVHIFDNLFHETMNEVEEEKEKVLDIISKWIMNQISGKKSAAKSKTTSSKKTSKSKTKSKKPASTKRVRASKPAAKKSKKAASKPSKKAKKKTKK